MRLIWLEDAPARQPELVGSKAATLSLLMSDYRVPPGFCVVFERSDIHDSGPDESLRNDLVTAYRELGKRCNAENVSVAGRSSGVGEDGSETSFAGQHETLLNVRGAAPVAEAVQRCLASATSPRALAYRARYGLERPGGFTVLVQQLVPAETAVVAFSLDPVTSAEDHVLINASWGLGESIVGGQVTPDAFVVSKDKSLIISRQIALKECMTVLTENGTRDAPVPLEQQRAPSLSDRQVIKVASLCRSLEARMGFPVDLECVFVNGILFLLQCRPITAF